ncbi:hypothetical protein CONCODRAFT_14005 [Conidiobolus coronatus NRRL 28638]|uniref:Outer arm dynein light chain 1 n=1 Tax=Conidiobolus coronatus (strain ATCC 28846 / CBS 209.66 / NRRL 28638) TaxID=796925 RepID=A0A137NPS7_CONC2|nr:hypothetical protein CONCODRAFT_14005 [Conidiobolus coronatus NRRL 28638]|eukprot:KXN64742.1 hypothetical protein CONCODRAFT_14005 [Conidiobolus coronatus NRRL 28638]
MIKKTWFNNLLELNLHFNNFTNNNSLLELSKFPKLRKLALSYNQLNYFTDPNNPKLINEALEELHIDENPLSDWLAISQLVISFPNLTALKLFPNTLINDEFAIGRANTLGKLLKLTRLNGSDVSKEERTDWERYYLSKIISIDLDKLNQIDFNKLHPTYNELVKKHGEVQVQKPQVDDSKLKNRLKKLNFHQVENTTNLTPIKSISKSVLSNLNILQLQTLILKLFKLKINSSQLIIFPLSNPELIFDLKSRNLEFYGIEDGQDLGFYY